MPAARITAIAALLLLMLSSGISLAAVTLDQATRRVESKGVRVLSAQRAQHAGRAMYRFKVLTPQGRVRKLWVDPQSGRRKR